MTSSPRLSIPPWTGTADWAAYYRWLDAIRTEGDWIGWLRFFLAGVSQIADDAARTARGLYVRVNQDRQQLLATPGVTVTAIQLIERLPERPVITILTCGCSNDMMEATAHIKINKLLEAVGWRFFAEGDQAADIQLESRVTSK